MEEIAESILRIIGGAIRWFLWELIFRIILFNMGRLFLLLLTIGRYPRGYALEKDDEKIIWAGIAILVVIWTTIAIYNNIELGARI